MHQTVAGGGHFWTVIAATAGNANRCTALERRSMNTIDGLTLQEVKWNIYAFGRKAKEFAGKRDRARLDHTRAKWQKKYAEAAGYLTNNQERLAQFESCTTTRAVDLLDSSAKSALVAQPANH